MKSANVGSALHCKIKQNQRSQKNYAGIPVIPHAAIDEQTIPLGLSTSSHSSPNHTSIKIDCAVRSFPEFAYSQQKLICQALQEEITNGIRHEHSGYLRFWLHQQNEQIVFKLANKGSCPPQVHFGFGLSTFQQRVEDWEGTLNLYSNTPDCSKLFVQIPVCTAAGVAYE